MFGFSIRISGDFPAVAAHVDGHTAHLQELVRNVVSHLQEHGLVVGSAQLNGRDVAPHPVVAAEPDPDDQEPDDQEGASTKLETQPLRVMRPDDVMRDDLLRSE